MVCFEKSWREGQGGQKGGNYINACVVYYHYRYGAARFRLRPCMWRSVRSDGIDIGDMVETTGVGFERELFVAQVWGMHFVTRKGCILYRLRRSKVRQAL